jgi:hypothetical protein
MIFRKRIIRHMSVIMVLVLSKGTGFCIQIHRVFLALELAEISNYLNLIDLIRVLNFEYFYSSPSEEFIDS